MHRTRESLKSLLLAAAGIPALSILALAQTSPPVAPVRNVVDDYFGTKITDPYRWMEDMKAAEFQTWIKAQNDYTRAVLDLIPGRKALLASISNTAAAEQW